MIWDEWKRLTRFHSAARVAFDNEHLRIEALKNKGLPSHTITASFGRTVYTATQDEYFNTISDYWPLHSSVFLLYFSILESESAYKLGLDSAKDLQGGIELWGSKLLEKEEASWALVKDGKNGAVEVAVIRNIIAHGGRSYTSGCVNRLRNAGFNAIPSVNDPVLLNDDIFDTYRARMKSFLRICKAGRN